MFTVKKISRHSIAASLILLLSFALISCGGGGGGGTPQAGSSGPTAPPLTAALKLNAGDSRASFQNLKAVFNNAGQGVVVWSEQSGMSSRVLWAYFDGAVMHPEEELAVYATLPSVATNGTDFMLVWQYNKIYSARCSSSGALDTVIPVSDWNAQSPAIASNGSGYAVTWSAWNSVLGKNAVYTNIYSASSWTNWTSIGTSTAGIYPRIASDGNGYAVTWQAYDGISNYDVYAAVSNGGTGTATWAAPSLLEDQSGHAAYPNIASNGSGYAVAWAQYDGSVYNVFSNIYSGGTWSTGGTLLETNSRNLVDPYNVEIASNGSGYAVAWSQLDGTSISAYANVYSGGTWTNAAVLESSPNSAIQVAIASNGAGYAVAWQQDNGVEKDINASLYSAGSWSTPVLLDASTAGAQQPLAVRFPTGYAVAWYQDDPSGNPNMYGTIYAGSVWSSPPEQLVQGVWRGTSFVPKMATNKSGVSLAVWPEYHKGFYRLYGSINASGAWGAPFLVDDKTYQEIALSTNGTSFMILWYSPTLGTPLAVTCSSNGTLGTPEMLAPADFIGAYIPSLASNGSGYAAVWQQWTYTGDYAQNIYANVYSNGSWSKDGGGNPTPWVVENSPYYAYGPRIASNGNGYAAAWVQSDGSAYSVYANLFTAGTWSTGGTLLENGSYDADGVAIASNGSGYGVSWYQNDGAVNYDIYANVYSSGTWSSSGALLEHSDDYATSPSIASNGSSYAVAWTQRDSGGAYNIYANLFTSGTWSTGGTLLETGSGGVNVSSIASDGIGYAVSWTQAEGAYYNVYANIYSSGTWSTGATLLETYDGDADSTMIISNGNKYSVIWWQQDPSEPLVYDVWAKLGF